MKIKQMILVTSLALGPLLCFGQIDQSQKKSQSFQLQSTEETPLYVLKVDDKVLEFDARKNEHLDLQTIDPTAISLINVTKGNPANGQRGVVEITLKDFNLLSKELQTKFTDSNKK
jgi:hypothetical protein